MNGEIMNYIRPELLSVSAVLYLAGMALKKNKNIPDERIPFILGAAGIFLCGIWVFATSCIEGFRCVLTALFTSVVQGILTAGLSTYLNQMKKQYEKTKEGQNG